MLQVQRLHEGLSRWETNIRGKYSYRLRLTPNHQSQTEGRLFTAYKHTGDKTLSTNVIADNTTLATFGFNHV